MLVEDTRSMWKERIPLSLDEGLGYAQRAITAAVRSGSPEEIAELEIMRTGNHGELVWSGSAQLDPQSTATGRPLDDGRYDILIRIRALGLVRQKRLGANRLDDLDQLPLMVDWRGHIYEYAYTGRDNLSLAVEARTSSLLKALRTAVVVPDDDGLAVNTGVVHAGPYFDSFSVADP